MVLAQLNAPSWAPIAVSIAAILALSVSLIMLITWYRNNR